MTHDTGRCIVCEFRMARHVDYMAGQWVTLCTRCFNDQLKV